MKNLFIMLVFMGLSPVFAQEIKDISPNNSWLKGGIIAGIPVGDASDSSSFNLGLDLRAQYLLTPNVAIGATSGYNHFFGKDNVDDFGIIPLAGFLRYYPSAEGLFIGSDLGYGILTNVDDNNGGLYVNPQIGYHNRDWNIFAFYQNTFTENDVDIQTVGIGVTHNIRIVW